MNDKSNQQRGGGGRSQRGGRGGDRRPQEDREWDQRILDLARVTRVTKGGKHMRFRAAVLVGNRKGQFGFSMSKGLDVQQAVAKAAKRAQKNIITIPLVNETIPHEATARFGASQIIMKPAPRGTGVKAGGALRVAFELAGVPNVVGKILGSNNKYNNVKALIKAVGLLRARS